MSGTPQKCISKNEDERMALLKLQALQGMNESLKDLLAAALQILADSSISERHCTTEVT